ncbi:hypothetical protein PENTCL1PPCAC_15760 [Pristionchus entomophagus]|uniref:Nuclear receptor n=1 Tax=Pristionchus entomophagus TaxID=358040 RepID=A0AAV5TGV1_9BILA|nr:hypothetical protein PENTCL1PPCAC_15760 [Pristionchus entomophagus]
MSTAMGKRVCLICGAPTNYAHFGIDSCRACAEFYKRTVTTNKNYACRQGNRQCRISKSERFVCRRCRYEKCRDLGMSLDDPRKRKRVEETAVPVKHEEPSPSTSTCHPSPPQESIIDRIAREHTTSITRRKCVEMSIRPTSLREHIRVHHDDEDLLLCSWTFLMDCLRMYAGDYFSLAGACFPEFEGLTLDEKRLMLQSCAARIYILESHCITAKVFGTGTGPLSMRRCMITLTTVLDRDNIKFLIQDSNPSARHHDIVNSMTYYMDRLEKIVWPALEKTELTETEFHALFGLVVWQIDPCQHLPDRLHDMAEKIRQEIFEDLRRYYREELKLSDYSVRMGNLMTLEHTVQEANSLMAEEMQTYNLLDMLHADASFLQVVLQIKL